ncbi:MAG: threonylcarbamoyl-AMP synthase [Candidatus Omnitrophica bacterium]|nr:MAG: Threonylcarbamoyl-AMP synthase [Candidatus Hinthialibacteria bacterium OLB16]MCK6496371.1 threonylcarbamoyl-AMP synthase [bacterium]MCL4736335.1 threonylcarbamoyl-AMP synthase [Candidatus Omnitrophota bacterium]NUP93102.1 threonylcarbamoyl-AMP synthase [Candidatus Omnitrophota bacterium]
MTAHLYYSPLKWKELAELVNQVRLGGVGLFPTDTVYGIGCRANSNDSTMAIYRIKERPVDKTLPLLIGGWEMFDRYCGKIATENRQRLEELWPGALTVVVPASQAARTLSYHCIREGTIAMRMPNHARLRFLIEQLGVPLASTSANLSGKSEALTLEMVSQKLRGAVDWAWSEPIPQKEPLPSTVIDLSRGEVQILREGGIHWNGKKTSEDPCC